MKQRIPGETFHSQAQKDARVQKLYVFDKQGHYRLPFQKLTKEILNLQANRKFRSISSTDIVSDVQTRTIDWTTENAAIFSRANQIRMQAFSKKRLLEEHLKAARKYLGETYTVYLKAEISTIKGREVAIKDSLEYFNKILFRLDTILQLCDMFLLEINHAGFSVNHTIETLRISAAPTRNI